MPVRKSATEKLAKAAEHRKACQQLELDARAEKIFSIVRYSAELCGACESALIESGIDLEAAFKEDAKAPVAKKATSKKIEVEPTTLLPRTTTSFGGLHQDILMFLATNLGEAVITPYALAALKPSPKKNISKSSVQELIEYATECSPVAFIGTSGPLKVLGNLQRVLTELNSFHGHRLRCLPLPPIWESHGVYQFSIEGSSIHITHKFLTERATRPLPSDQAAVVRDSAKLHIEANYSSKNAILTEDGGVLTFPLKKLFGDSFPDDPFDDVRSFVLVLPSDGAGLASKQPMLTDSGKALPASSTDSPSKTEVRIPFNLKRMHSQAGLAGSGCRKDSVEQKGSKARRSEAPSMAIRTPKKCSTPDSEKEGVQDEQSMEDVKRELDPSFEEAQSDNPNPTSCKVSSELDIEVPSPTS